MDEMYVKETAVVYRRGNHRVKRRRIVSSRDVLAVARRYLPDGPTESIIALGLNSKNEIVNWTRLGVGGMAACPLSAADVLRWALLSGVSSFVLVHNHPSGNPTPSAEDIALTERVHEAAKIMGLRILDHVVLAYDDNDQATHFSMLDAGMMP
jgi:DNA repair protein RadC